MSTSLLVATALARAAAPLIKDLYEGAKGTTRKALDKWSATGFPKKLTRRLVEIDTVRTIWSPEENVSLRSFYYPCRIRSKEGQDTDILNIETLGEGCIVIQGIVGQGKSILLRYLALEELLRPSDKRMPVFLELRKISKEINLRKLIDTTLSAYAIEVNDQIFEYLASSGRIVLLLDGFDELEPQAIRSTTGDIEHLSLKYPELQIIVTSRPNNEIQKLSTFRILEVAPLKSADYSPFLKALGLKATKIADIIGAIEASPSKVADLITTPLMLTLVVFVYQSEKQIPADLPEFFDRLFYTVFTRHDKLKAAFEREHFSGLSERKLQILFEAFCFMSLQLGTSRTLNPSQFSEAFDLAQDYVEGGKCDESKFRKDITKVACLMLEEGVGDATFLHKSIAEYHAAAFVKASDDAFAQRFYVEAAKAWTQWQETLRFLQSIDPYRFSKYFAIANLQAAIPLFERLAACNGGRELVALLPEWIRTVSIKYKPTKQGSDQYFCSQFGSWSPADNFYSHELSDVLSDSCFKTAPTTMSKSAIEELREVGLQITDAGSSELNISCADALDQWSMAECKLALAIRITKLRNKLQEAEAHSEKLAKRSLIFDRKR